MIREKQIRKSKEFYLELYSLIEKYSYTFPPEEAVYMLMETVVDMILSTENKSSEESTEIAEHLLKHVITKWLKDNSIDKKLKGKKS